MSRGGYTQRVEFLKPMPVTDAAGQQTIGYVLDFTARADCLVISSRKVDAGRQVYTGADIVMVRLLFNRKVSPQHRIRWEGTEWDVRSIRDKDGRRSILEVEAERVEVG
jgi:head-tail adaptor